MRKRYCYSVVCVLLLMVCMGADGKTHWPWSVKVAFEANPATISKGETSTLSWSSSRATRSASLDGQAVSLSGSLDVTPNETTNYTLTVSGRRLSLSRMITVTVVEPQPTPTPTPEPQPTPEPAPLPGVLQGAVLIEETKLRTPQLAAIITSAKVNDYFDDNSLTFRVADQNAKDKDDKPPGILVPYLDAAKKAGKLPRLFIIGADGGLLYEGDVPETVDAFLSLVSSSRVPKAVKAEPQSPCPGGSCPINNRPSFFHRR